MNASKKIIELMEQRGLTRQLIAMHMGKNRTSISKYIESPEELKVGDFLKLCEVLNCEPYDILKEIIEDKKNTGTVIP